MSLKLKNGNLYWDGRSIDVIASRDLIQAVMKLPVSATDPNTFTVRKFFRNLTPPSLKSVQSFRGVDSEFEKFVSRLEFEYADVAYPETGEWPEFEEDEILDSVFVDCPPVQNIVTLLDGRRFAIYFSGSNRKILSFSEFEDYCGCTVRAFLHRTAVVKIHRLKKALEIVDADKPKLFEVSVFGKHGVGTRKLLAYTEDQLSSYMSGREESIISSEQHEVELENGRYRESAS